MLNVSGYARISFELSDFGFVQASDGIANFASCYALGKQECGAAVNLLTKIPGEVKDCLTLLVQRLGFDILARCVFLNKTYMRAPKHPYLSHT